MKEEVQRMEKEKEPLTIKKPPLNFEERIGLANLLSIACPPSLKYNDWEKIIIMGIKADFENCILLMKKDKTLFNQFKKALDIDLGTLIEVSNANHFLNIPYRAAILSMLLQEE